MFGPVKRLVIGSLVAALLLGGALIAPGEADARTVVRRSDDGKLVLVCHYDDVTGELAFCDVYWFPLQAAAANASLAQ